MSNLQQTLQYYKCGISIVPQIPGGKRPAISWAEYQIRPALVEVVHSWYFLQPDAGMFAVLGPVSNLLVIDVDGPDGHQALIERLGRVPVAPTVISGSGKPCRYHSTSAIQIWRPARRQRHGIRNLNSGARVGWW